MCRIYPVSFGFVVFGYNVLTAKKATGCRVATLPHSCSTSHRMFRQHL